MKVEERLADLTADLVECEENSVFLEGCFLSRPVYGRTSRLCAVI
jgi:hypothetical protein